MSKKAFDMNIRTLKCSLIETATGDSSSAYSYRMASMLDTADHC